MLRSPVWGHGAVGLIVRLLLVTTGLVLLAMHFSEPAVHALLPLLREVFEAVTPDFRLLQFGIDHQGGDRVLRATVMWAHIQVLGGKVIYPDPLGTANASTLVAHVFQGPLTAVIVALAWPSRANARMRWLEWALRAIVGLPLLIAIVMLDVPLVLAGELWEMVLQALEPGSLSVLAAWKGFMQGGGRYALGVAGGSCAVLSAQALIVRLHQLRESSARREPIAST
jgi:hypothetical protein